MANIINPPIADKIPKTLTKFGDKRLDNYYWMRERENPKVIDYLKAENNYAEKTLIHTKPLQEKLFQEMKSRIKGDDQTVPVKIDNYFYYTRTEKGKEYPIYCRRKDSLDNPEEIIFDVNKHAEGHEFYSASINVSDDHKILAYAADTKGRRFYNIRFINLETKKELPDQITNVSNAFEWASDNSTLFYEQQDPETLRVHQVYRYKLGGSPELVFEEKDETFSISLDRSRTKTYLLIDSYSTLSSENRYIDASQPQTEPVLFQKRGEKHEYSVFDGGDRFYILTNHKAKNFRVMEVGKDKTDMKYWKEVIPHRTTHLIEHIGVFKNHIVLLEKYKGLTAIEVFKRSNKKRHLISFKNPTYEVWPDENPNFDTDFYRYSYTSLNAPESIYSHDLNSKDDTLLKIEEVPRFNPDDYVTEWLWAKSKDGTKAPVSVIYKRSTKLDGSAPLYLDGYGSYGSSNSPSFIRNWISLLDRGFICGVAHTRGGSEMGREWYEDGKLLKKKNTFYDFIAITEHLIKKKYAHPKKVYAYGASAGGILMGFIANYRPDLYNGIVAQVPFVDVVTTMLDDSIPLTTSEYDEWGNPNKKQYYKYMKSYSPYDNVKKQNYPNMLVLTGFHDSQVQYWEPAKWVAKLRDMKTDGHELIFKTEMGQGHGGASGRFESLRDLALQFAFFLDIEGVKE